jgi:HK97 gp10 family phage protein
MSTNIIIIDHTDKAFRGNKDSIENAILQSCIKVVAKAKILVPDKTGELKGSLGYNTTKQSVGDIVTLPDDETGIVGATAPHAPYIEFGTRYMTPQPYIRPAIAMLKSGTSRQDIARVIRESMNQYLFDFKGGI